MVKRCQKCDKILIHSYRQKFCEKHTFKELITENDILQLLEASMKPLVDIPISNHRIKINPAEVRKSLQIAINEIYKDKSGKGAYSNKHIEIMEKTIEEKVRQLENQELSDRARVRLERSLLSTQECINWRIFVKDNAEK